LFPSRGGGARAPRPVGMGLRLPLSDHLPQPCWSSAPRLPFLLLLLLLLLRLGPSWKPPSVHPVLSGAPPIAPNGRDTVWRWRVHPRTPVAPPAPPPLAVAALWEQTSSKFVKICKNAALGCPIVRPRPGKGSSWASNWIWFRRLTSQVRGLASRNFQFLQS